MSRALFVILSTFLITLPAINAAPSDSEATTEKKIITRDQWWLFKDLFTDLPRFFDVKDNNKCPVDGEQFYDDCNSCFCVEGLASGCTRRGCVSPPQISNWENGRPCPAEKTFFLKCNECTCNKDGKSANCTDKPCPEPTEA